MSVSPALRRIVEVAPKVEGAVHHRAIVLRRADQHARATAKQKQLSILRMDANRLTLRHHVQPGPAPRNAEH